MAHTVRNPAIALLLASLLCSAVPARAEESWLSVGAPAPEARFSGPLIEVRGRAGPRGLSGHDFIIAIDLSDSTIASSGVDLDGDGPQGRTDPELIARLQREPDVRPGLIERLRASDFDDSVLAAELAAAETLISRLEPRRFRVGLVVFSDDAWLAAPVGSSRERLRRVLERTRRSFFRDLRGTHLAAAVRSSHHFLRRVRRSGEARRQQSILILSDGAPTLPVHADRAAEQARAAAREAAADGIRIYAFALGHEGAEALDVYRDMAAAGGGRTERIASPADAIARLRRVDLADLESLKILNTTTGKPARALRVFPDGSFDGFLELALGGNQIRVDARASDGRQVRVVRDVVRERRDRVPSDAERKRLRGLVGELQRRTRELELWSEVERGRRQPRRDVIVEGER